MLVVLVTGSDVSSQSLFEWISVMRSWKSVSLQRRLYIFIVLLVSIEVNIVLL